MVQAASDQKHSPDDRKLTPVSEAQEKWDLKPTAFYARLKFLGIQPIKQGRKSFLDEEQIASLDELDEYIQEHGNMEGFGETGKLATVNAAKLAAESEVDIAFQDEVSQSKSTADEQFQGIIRSAKEHRAGVEIAKYAIASRLEVEDLDQDLIEEIESVRAATLPKSRSASTTAGAILNQFMQGRI